jgi:Gram-negative bacterial TonB protein C-terminal
MGVRSEDMTGRVRRAVERSTLDQSGTKPFHLKAVLAPSFERDKDCNRTGEVEFWWASPTRWRREVRSPEFQQIELVDGGRDWQKNEGDYFPEWLRQIAVALVRPVPDLKQVLGWVKTAEVRSLMGQTNIVWDTVGNEEDEQEELRGGVGLMDSTGLLIHGGGPGWGFRGQDYQDFHGRMVARMVSVGTPEVTARVVVLEDLGKVPAGLFDAKAQGEDEMWLTTVAIGEMDLRKNLLPSEAVSWPTLEEAPLEGRVTAGIVVDREGKVRELETVEADNPGVIEAATEAFTAMRFRPYLVDGVPVQVVARMRMPFKATGPPGLDSFESAQMYFDRGREVGFPSAGSGLPYLLKAEFSARGSSGEVEKGSYEDTWVSDTVWRREAWFGQSRYARTRNGDERYELSEGPEAGLLRLVFRVIEPIPSTNRFEESDWRIQRDLVDGVSTVRVATGNEGPDGQLDPVHFRGFWFAETGQVVKTYARGLETRLMAFSDFDGGRVTRRVNVLTDGKPVMRVQVTQLQRAGRVDSTMFALPGHELARALVDEVR